LVLGCILPLPRVRQLFVFFSSFAHHSLAN
jgi:hypothetical protein